MAYYIRRNQRVQQSVRNIATEQIDKAISEISDERIDCHKSVHQVRKRCKKIRALIRLIRPQFEAYQEENRFFRDLARSLSFIRDAQSIVESLDQLLEHYKEHVDCQAFASIRNGLTSRRQKITRDEAGLEQLLAESEVKLRQARGRAELWEIGEDDFAAISGGLQKTYRRSRKAMRQSYRDLDSESFHDWRKRVKYHWYHARLLRKIWPKMMKSWRKTADDLADLLGDEHDLDVLLQTLEAEQERFSQTADLNFLSTLIERRRGELRAQARLLGERLFAEKPSRLKARFKSYWRSWQDSKTSDYEAANELTRS